MSRGAFDECETDSISQNSIYNSIQTHCCGWNIIPLCLYQSYRNTTSLHGQSSIFVKTSGLKQPGMSFLDTNFGAIAPLDWGVWWTSLTVLHRLLVEARDFEWRSETTVELTSSIVISVEVGADYCVGSILLETSSMVLRLRFRTILIFPILFFSFYAIFKLIVIVYGLSYDLSALLQNSYLDIGDRCTSTTILGFFD
jgi:hypothetical protein